MTVRGDPKRVQLKQGGKAAEYFDFEDFKKARDDYPELFEWLDYPEKYVEQFLKQNETSQHAKNVEELLSYNQVVTESFRRMILQISEQYSLNEPDEAATVEEVVKLMQAVSRSDRTSGAKGRSVSMFHKG